MVVETLHITTEGSDSSHGMWGGRTDLREDPDEDAPSIGFINWNIRGVPRWLPEAGRYEAYIHQMKVSEGRRRRGLGTRFYRAWEQNLPERVRYVTLNPHGGRGSAAARFWLRQGFSWRYLESIDEPDAPENYEMIKGVGGTPTPPPFDPTTLSSRDPRRRGTVARYSRRDRRSHRDPARMSAVEDAVMRAKVRLIQGRRLEVQGPGRLIVYMGSTDAPRRDSFWYEHPGGRTYKEDPEDVVRAVLKHVGYQALNDARVHERDPASRRPVSRSRRDPAEYQPKYPPSREASREETEAEQLYRSLSRASKEYLESYVSDVRRADVEAAYRRVPKKDVRAIRILVEGVTPAYEYAEAAWRSEAFGPSDY